ncbi:uncharacterized protein LOC116209540 isoform X2 [Punica granatum]|nr:uncharacterized protein LOC116209540 isoform X2 [Punica granatum]OWM64434.1 hypothetical protein CDL15_Pgr020401 [Punica granatum]PKI75626.1 hypothetical protein CRG98_004027 [Punica granatum]
MDHFRGVDQNAFAAALEEMRGFTSISDRIGAVVCPKPRRLGPLSSDLLTLQVSHRPEVCESRAGAPHLDLFLTEEDFEVEQQPASAAAFFSGSPPSRADNPLAQDPRFRDERINPVMALPTNFLPSGLPSPSSSARKGCVRMKFGLKPATVRIEGFDCLNRDGQNSSIPAFA